MSQKILTRDEARKLIENENSGKIFTVTFVTRGDQTKRKMNCRTGVKKNVKGTGLRFDPSKNNLKPVYDVKKKEHRFVALENITEIKMNKKVYSVAQSK